MRNIQWDVWMVQTDRDKSIVRETVYLLVLLCALAAVFIAVVCLLMVGNSPANEGIIIAKLIAGLCSVIGFVLSVAAIGFSYSKLTLIGASFTLIVNGFVQTLAFG